MPQAWNPSGTCARGGTIFGRLGATSAGNRARSARTTSARKGRCERRTSKSSCSACTGWPCTRRSAVTTMASRWAGSRAGRSRGSASTCSTGSSTVPGETRSGWARGRMSAAWPRSRMDAASQATPVPGGRPRRSSGRSQAHSICGGSWDRPGWGGACTGRLARKPVAMLSVRHSPSPARASRGHSGRAGRRGGCGMAGTLAVGCVPAHPPRGGVARLSSPWHGGSVYCPVLRRLAVTGDSPGVQTAACHGVSSF